MTKFIMMLLLGLIIFLPSSDAAKTDVYRDALRNKNFTLKYELLTPPVHNVNRSGVLRQGGFLNPVSLKGSEDSIKYSGIIVVDGDNKYVETISEDNKKEKSAAGVCKLIKDGETFNFYWDMKKNQKRYYGGYGTWGGHSKNVAAENSFAVDPYQAMFQEYNYGIPTLTKALFALMPLDKIIAVPNLPVYKFLGSGSLANGLSYEDYYDNQNNNFYAVRYYFDGNQLVKIATLSYVKQNGIIVSYEKSIIGITEFSTAPDQKYLSLPEGLKDTTKRNKKEESK